MADPERAPLVRRAFEEHATGRFTKEQLLKQSRAWGLTNRRGCPLTSQAIGVLLRNQRYAGIVDVPKYGVREKQSDFEPRISEFVVPRHTAGVNISGNGVGRRRSRISNTARTPPLASRRRTR